MFKEVLKELEKLDGSCQVAVPIEADERGFVEKECPAKDCEFVFKIMLEDWDDKVSEHKVFCPACRRQAPADSWWTQEQLKHAEQQAVDHLGSRVMSAFHRDAKQFNRLQSKNSFVSMSMKASGDGKVGAIVPAPVIEKMVQDITCDKCSTRFAVVGCSFFCPACGESSAVAAFESSVRKMLVGIDRLEVLQDVVNISGSNDEAYLLSQKLFEYAIQNNVGTFQALADELYEKRTGKIPKKNVFQRLSEGSALWKSEFGKSFGDYLSSEELGRLAIYYQRRHLLSHRNGVVDNEYIQKTNDPALQVGQRLIVSEAEVREMTALVEKLGKALLKEK